MGHVYFEAVWPQIIYQAFAYQKSLNKACKDVSIAKELSSEEIIKFSNIVEIQGKNRSVTQKIILGGKEMSESTNDTETEYASVEDSLNMHRIALNETTLVSEIPSIINEENDIITPREGKIPVSVLGDELCEEQKFTYGLHKGKFGYNAPGDIPMSSAWYFNQMFNFNQYFE